SCPDVCQEGVREWPNGRQWTDRGRVERRARRHRRFGSVRADPLHDFVAAGIASPALGVGVLKPVDDEWPPVFVQCRQEPDERDAALMLQQILSTVGQAWRYGKHGHGAYSRRSPPFREASG